MSVRLSDGTVLSATKDGQLSGTVKVADKNDALKDTVKAAVKVVRETGSKIKHIKVKTDNPTIKNQLAHAGARAKPDGSQEITAQELEKLMPEFQNYVNQFYKTGDKKTTRGATVDLNLRLLDDSGHFSFITDVDTFTDNKNGTTKSSQVTGHSTTYSAKTANKKWAEEFAGAPAMEDQLIV